jgi:glycosyltransferase involved in cell wall biosynthesis
VLNEEGVLTATLEHARQASVGEIIVVDGGSSDGTPALAASVEAEFSVEALRLVELRHSENEAIERMYGSNAVPTHAL